MDKNGLISVVTVVFNHKDGIETTVQSILNQTYEHVQYIIIDGGSTDGTIDLIRRYENQLFYWISEPDNGIYDAMNKGINMATGDWTIFMNSGDRFYSTHTLSNIFGKMFESDVLYGDAIVEYSTFSTLLPRTPLNKSWKRMPFSHQSCFVRTSLLKNIKFDLTYKICADYNLVYTLYLMGKSFSNVNEIVCYYNYKEGLSKNMVIKSTNERKRIVLKSGFSLSKWLYYSLLIGYLKIALGFKKIIGEKGTACLTRLLKD